VRKKELIEFLNRNFPLKSLGQNFLIKESVLKKISSFAEIKESDFVLEIGAGFGNLTKELAKKAKKVLAIEKDKRMVNLAKEFLKDFKNVEILNEDILKIDLSELNLPKGYKVVGNLPYYISKPIIQKFLKIKEKPSLMIFLVQKEVAQRICAKAPKTNFLALFVQFYAKAEILDYVKKDYFWPKPKVDGAILKIESLKNSYEKVIEPEIFFKVLKAGFLHPRKQIINNLTSFLGEAKIKIIKVLQKNKIPKNKRPENLNLKLWIKLAKSLKNFLK
jgi:16S rRNA (adenine1518-N6/adenine1519-N6)-dimethyltransferase